MISSPRESTTTRSITFSNSLTLPGHRYPLKYGSRKVEEQFRPALFLLGFHEEVLHQLRNIVRPLRKEGVPEGSLPAGNNRSSRNAPSSTIACKLRCVAAMIRTSTFVTPATPSFLDLALLDQAEQFHL